MIPGLRSSLGEEGKGYLLQYSGLENPTGSHDFHFFTFTSPVILKRSLVLLILLCSFISLHCSFKKAFLSLLALLWKSVFSWVYLSLSPLLFTSLFSAIYKASSDNHFAFLHFFYFGMVLITASCKIL